MFAKENVSPNKENNWFGVRTIDHKTTRYEIKVWVTRTALFYGINKKRSFETPAFSLKFSC